MFGQVDLTASAIAIAGAWMVSAATLVGESVTVGALMLAYSGALTMLYVGQRRQRLMLLESIEIAKYDRDECRSELASLKHWVAENLEKK